MRLKIRNLVLCLVLFSFLVHGVAASTQITFRDTMNDSDMEGRFYNATGAQEVILFSNGSTYDFPSGSYIVQVLPADAGYRANPLKIIDLLFLAVKVVLSFALVYIIAVGLRDLARKVMEIWL